MKAALFQKAHEPLTIEDLDLAELRPDEVRVRTVCSGVCHSDLHVVDGMGTLPMPMVLGHESSGVVEEVGKAVTYVKPGDRVIMSLKPFCGCCYYCLGGRPHRATTASWRRPPRAGSRGRASPCCRWGAWHHSPSTWSRANRVS